MILKFYILNLENPYLKNLLILKKNKYFKKIGVSIYDSKCLNYLISRYKIDVVQCPYNIFDKRIINSGWFRKT